MAKSKKDKEKDETIASLSDNLSFLKEELIKFMDLNDALLVENKNLKLSLSIALEDFEVEKQRSDKLINICDNIQSFLCKNKDTAKYVTDDFLFIRIADIDCSPEEKVIIIEELKNRHLLDSNFTKNG